MQTTIKLLLISIFGLASTALTAKNLEGKWSIFLSGSIGKYSRIRPSNISTSTGPSLFSSPVVPTTTTATRPKDKNWDEKYQIYRIHRSYIKQNSYETTVKIGNFGFEYHYTNRIGFTLSLAGRSAISNCTNCTDGYVISNFLLGPKPAGYTGSKTDLSQTYGFLDLQTSLTEGSNVTGMLRLGVVLHVLPDSVVDPYLTLRAGYGIGGNQEVRGQIPQGNAAIGVRINMNKTFFAFIEGGFVVEEYRTKIFKASYEYPEAAFGIGFMI